MSLGIIVPDRLVLLAGAVPGRLATLAGAVPDRLASLALVVLIDFVVRNSEHKKSIYG